jgi:GNAT superfamily N-acetyltransferase
MSTPATVRSSCEITAASTPSQIEQVRSLFREYRAELPLPLCFGQFDAELRELPGYYAPPAGSLLLATIIGQPVGCVGLRSFPQERTCEMKRLYVRPPFRAGKIGVDLVQAIIQDARRLGYARVRLDSHSPTMQSAVQMYRRFGFRQVDASPVQQVEDLIYMELTL